jgi:hypothetical protein
MRRSIIGFSTLAAIPTVLAIAGHWNSVRAAGSDDAVPLVGELEWQLPAADRAYAAIDGKRIWQYVVQQAEISRRYRDQGHPQFWGRIIGTSGDAEDARWLADNFTRIGLSDVRIQSLDLQPQWFPQSWEVTASSGGKTTALTSAQPAYRTPGTQGPGLDLQAVYVGEGTPADFLGREVRGKAVFISSVCRLSGAACPAAQAQGDSLRMSAERGAAAVFYTYTLLNGNVKYQSYPLPPNVPTFVLGSDDGHAVEEMIARAPVGDPPHIRIRLDTQLVPNLKTALVWGTLPGDTDETIYVVGHRDGWFDAGTDNASGIATMLGLAEYFAKVPKSRRHRTIVFVGLDGHHNSGPGSAVGVAWLYDHRSELFSKTALMLNAEHTAAVIALPCYRDCATQFQGTMGLTNMYLPLPWYAGGPGRPQLEKLVGATFKEFGVAAWLHPDDKPPAGDLGRFSTFLPGIEIQSNDFVFMHTDANTPETVPWTGLQAITRADAKIIDEVNKLEIKDLQPTAEASARSSQ